MLPSITLGALLLASGIEASYPIQKFKSTNLQATTIKYNTYNGGDTAQGYLFIEPQTGETSTAANGPQILTQEGELIWRLPNTSSGAGANFNNQVLNNQNYLTYWEGDGASNYGFGYGGVVFLDQTYTQVYKVCLSNLNIKKLPGPTTQNCLLDLHESRVTPSGTLLATVRNITRADMSSVGGPKDGYVLDSVFVEVDIPTQNIIMLWSAVEHLDQLNFFKISQTPPSNGAGQTENNPWDFMHMNSVASTAAPQAGYIFSARYLSSAIKLDTEGNVQWFLQGNGTYRGGNFSLPADATFRYEHDIVPLGESATGLDITMFDNNNIGNGKEPSSGLRLSINTVNKQVTLVQRYNPPQVYTSQATGSYQTLGNGNVLVDYGHPAVLNEWASDGTLLYQATIGASDYRAYKYGWIGNPTTKPQVAAVLNFESKTTTAYVSWNGATQVDHWVLSAGATASKLEQIGTTYPKNGFETKVVMKGSYAFVQASAIASNGTKLSSSNVVFAT